MRLRSRGFTFVLLACSVLGPGIATAAGELLCVERVAHELAPQAEEKELPRWDLWLERRAARQGIGIWSPDDRPLVFRSGRQLEEAIRWAEAGVHFLRANNYWADGGIEADAQKDAVGSTEAVLREVLKRQSAPAKRAQTSVLLLELAVAAEGLSEGWCASWSGRGSRDADAGQFLLTDSCAALLDQDPEERRVFLWSAYEAAELEPANRAFVLLRWSELEIRRGYECEAADRLKEVMTEADSHLWGEQSVHDPVLRGELRWLKLQAWIRLQNHVFAMDLSGCPGPSDFTGALAPPPFSLEHPVVEALTLMRAQRVRDPTAIVSVESSGESATLGGGLHASAPERWHEPIVARLRIERDSEHLSIDGPLLNAAIGCLQMAAGDDLGFADSVGRLELLMSPDSEWMGANGADSRAWARLSVAVDLLESVGWTR